MYLYFVRHGVAVERDPNFFDSGRYLTVEGRKKIRSVYTELASEFPESTIIWSSPLVRAVQTAEILAQRCKLSNVEIKDFIVSGSFQDLIYELYNFLDDDKKNGPVVIVGHEPFLSYWTNCLVGKNIYYKKGSVSKINIKSKKSNLSDGNGIPFNMEFVWYKAVKDLQMSKNDKSKLQNK